MHVFTAFHIDACVHRHELAHIQRCTHTDIFLICKKTTDIEGSMAVFIIQVCGHIFQNKKAKSNFLLIVILMEIRIKRRSTKKKKKSGNLTLSRSHEDSSQLSCSWIASPFLKFWSDEIYLKAAYFCPVKISINCLLTDCWKNSHKSSLCFINNFSSRHSMSL